MKVMSVTNFNITPYNKSNKQPSRVLSNENTSKSVPAFRGTSSGAAIGAFAGEIATLALKYLLGVTELAGIVIIATLCITGYTFLGDHIESKIMSPENNDSDE